MPKVNVIDAKTGAPTGDKMTNGRVVKANTNANPTTVTPAPQPQAQGQAPENVGAKPEATSIDPKFEALAKREAAFVAREREFKARESAMDAKIQEAVNKALGEYRDKLKSNTLDVLNDDVGLTYDELVQQALNRPDPTTQAIQQKLTEIEKRQAKLAEDAQNSAKQQRESAIKQIRYDVESLIKSDPEFEITKETGSGEDVVELITRTFDETGRLMTVEEAAKHVEAELEAEAIKIANLNKIKAKQPGLTPDLVNQTKQQTTQQQPITTLTNSMTSTKPLTARERAIRRFNGEKF